MAIMYLLKRVDKVHMLWVSMTYGDGMNVYETHLVKVVEIRYGNSIKALSPP